MLLGTSCFCILGTYDESTTKLSWKHNDYLIKIVSLIHVPPLSLSLNLFAFFCCYFFLFLNLDLFFLFENLGFFFFVFVCRLFAYIYESHSFCKMNVESYIIFMKWMFSFYTFKLNYLPLSKNKLNYFLFRVIDLIFFLLRILSILTHSWGEEGIF